MSRKIFFTVFLTVLTVTASSSAFAVTGDDMSNESILINGRFPAIAEQQNADTGTYGAELTPAIWPFSGGSNETVVVAKKSPRKAFFLSLLMPGFGQFYMGAKKTGLAYLAVEGFSWWLYITKTNDGNDKEDEFRAFADENWSYADEDGTQGYSYFEWLQENGYIDEDVLPTDYDTIAEQLADTDSNMSFHNYSGRKDQQDYEMIGKYDQFIYGWNDIVENNVALQNEDTTFNGNYSETIENITSLNRDIYETMRDESNSLLKDGQKGLYIMMVNRVISAIHAGRMAYKHNLKLESDISSININVVQEHVLDNYVPMLKVTKIY